MDSQYPERRALLPLLFVDRCLADIEGLMASVIDESATANFTSTGTPIARTLSAVAYDAVYLETAR